MMMLRLQNNQEEQLRLNSQLDSKKVGRTRDKRSDYIN